MRYLNIYKKLYLTFTKIKIKFKIFFVSIKYKMLDNKFLVILISLVLAVFALCNMNLNKSPDVYEGLGMLPSFVTKVDVTAAASRSAANKGAFFSVPGTYQAMLSPRFSNIQYGADIRYNMPSYANQAVPHDALSFGDMAKANYSRENFDSSEGVPSCYKGGVPKEFHTGAPLTPAGYADGNYNEVLDAAYSDSSAPEITSMIPVGDMTTINALGETVMPIVYDRYIYANRSNWLRSRGDKIRGDLPIVPCGDGWFRPSVQPNIDLEQGALAVLGGQFNEQGNSLADLVYATSGNSQTAISGINMVNQSNQFTGTTLAGQRDVQISAFP
jgi:hypothetical protein